MVVAGAWGHSIPFSASSLSDHDLQYFWHTCFCVHSGIYLKAMQTLDKVTAPQPLPILTVHRWGRASGLDISYITFPSTQWRSIKRCQYFCNCLLFKSSLLFEIQYNGFLQGIPCLKPFTSVSGLSLSHIIHFGHARFASSSFFITQAQSHVFY